MSEAEQVQNQEHCYPMVERRSNHSGHGCSIIDLVTDLKKSVQDLDDRVNQHMIVASQEVSAAVARILTEAFPEGDPLGHRRHHEAAIKAAEAKAELYAKLRFELYKWGLIGFAGWLLWNSWLAILKGPK